jgi:hypothetical protein
MNEIGEPVSRDLRAAFDFFERACALNEPDGCDRRDRLKATALGGPALR